MNGFFAGFDVVFAALSALGVGAVSVGVSDSCEDEAVVVNQPEEVDLEISLVLVVVVAAFAVFILVPPVGWGKER